MTLKPTMAELPEYRDLLVGIRSTGLLKKCSGGDCVSASVLLRHTLSVLRQIPQPVVPLAELAARATGDSHALDAGKPLSTLCLRAPRSSKGLSCPAPPVSDASCGNVWASWLMNSQRPYWCSTF